MNTFKKLISQRVNKIGTKINKLRGKIKWTKVNYN
jgi:hypothetical protein